MPADRVTRLALGSGEGDAVHKVEGGKQQELLRVAVYAQEVVVAQIAIDERQ
jgi:hypothetical protein